MYFRKDRTPTETDGVDDDDDDDDLPPLTF